MQMWGRLTHWGRVTHIYSSLNWVIIGSDNGMSPVRRQAIIWTNAGILLIGPLGTNFSETLIGIQTFSFKKSHLKASSVKWRLFCIGLNELTLNGSWSYISPARVLGISAQWIAQWLIYSTRTVKRLRGQHEQIGHSQRLSESGNTRKITARGDQRLCRLMLRKRFSTLEQLGQHFSDASCTLLSKKDLSKVAYVPRAFTIV